MSKASREQLNISSRFASISEDSIYTMKFLVGVLQFYTRKCDGNGVLWTRKRTNGHRCNICHEFLLSSSVKPLQKILLKRSTLFQNLVEIHYNPALVDSYQSVIRTFTKLPCSSISISVMEMLHKRKSHIDLHIELKGILSKEKLCPTGYPIVQVPGAN